MQRDDAMNMKVAIVYAKQMVYALKMFSNEENKNGLGCPWGYIYRCCPLDICFRS